MFGPVVQSFIALFVIMDVLGNIPMFLTLFEKLSHRHRIESANRSIIVAGLILLLFLLFGIGVLSFFNVSMDSFRIAGGLILVLTGLKYVLAIKMLEQKIQKYESAVVPIAIPLLVGPGVITTTMILVNNYGISAPFIASALNLLIAWVVLRHTEVLYRFIGRQGSDVLTRIMGLLITTIGIEFIRSGWTIP